MVQWLELGAFTAMARVQSLVGELPQATRHSQKKLFVCLFVFIFKNKLKYIFLIGKEWEIP